jgi:hypothetical protein
MKYGRQPQYFWKRKMNSIFSNGRRPQLCYSQPKKLIFSMQLYFDPARWNMEDDLNISESGRHLNFVLQTEDMFALANLGSWFLVSNIVSTQLHEIWKTPIFFNGRQPHFLKMEDNINFLKMYGDLNVFKNWGRHQFFENGRWPQ